MRALLAVIYAAAGILHLYAPEKLLQIMPPFVPFPAEIVFWTGIFELAAAVGLLIRRTRTTSAVLLATYAIAVWPANFKHAFTVFDPPIITNSWAYHLPRLALQPLIVWWTLYCVELIKWPRKR